jgi:hypothetical protein
MVKNRVDTLARGSKRGASCHNRQNASCTMSSASAPLPVNRQASACAGGSSRRTSSSDALRSPANACRSKVASLRQPSRQQAAQQRNPQVSGQVRASSGCVLPASSAAAFHGAPSAALDARRPTTIVCMPCARPVRDPGRCRSSPASRRADDLPFPGAVPAAAKTGARATAPGTVRAAPGVAARSRSRSARAHARPGRRRAARSRPSDRALPAGRRVHAPQTMQSSVARHGTRG